MNTTMDFKNGELPIKPVSWFLNMPFSGTTVNARMMAITINVPVAAHSAFFLKRVTCAAFLDQFLHHLIHYHYKALTEAQRFFL